MTQLIHLNSMNNAILEIPTNNNENPREKEPITVDNATDLKKLKKALNRQRLNFSPATLFNITTALGGGVVIGLSFYLNLSVEYKALAIAFTAANIIGIIPVIKFAIDNRSSVQEKIKSQDAEQMRFIINSNNKVIDLAKKMNFMFTAAAIMSGVIGTMYLEDNKFSIVAGFAAKCTHFLYSYQSSAQVQFDESQQVI
jgi:hypothetical protein